MQEDNKNTPHALNGAQESADDNFDLQQLLSEDDDLDAPLLYRPQARAPILSDVSSNEVSYVNLLNNDLEDLNMRIDKLYSHNQGYTTHEKVRVKVRVSKLSLVSF